MAREWSEFWRRSNLDSHPGFEGHYDGPKNLTADQKDRMTQESGLYDYDYGSYMEKKQRNEDTDMQKNKDTDTYHDHCDSLYKEKPMNMDTHIDANDAVSGAIRPAHYESSNPDVPSIQMWDYALSQNLGFFEGNIIKYGMFIKFYCTPDNSI